MQLLPSAQNHPSVISSRFFDIWWTLVSVALHHSRVMYYLARFFSVAGFTSLVRLIVLPGRERLSMKKILLALIATAFVALLLVGCTTTDPTPAPAPSDDSTTIQQQDAEKASVIIYSPNEDYLIEYYKTKLDEQFPDYDITVEYLSTGNLAAKLLAEGADTDCDFIIGMSYGYLDSLTDNLASIDFIDTSVFMPELIQADNKYIPWDRFSGACIVNTELLAEKNLAAPASYDDLLKPEYKGLIEMANPNASSTGYLFLKSLVNAWGEDKAFEYFGKLNDNILQYTNSGSGPIKDLVKGECAIGLSLTFNAVEVINDGAPLEIIFFEEGAPYSPTGCAIIAGREDKPGVKEMFEYLYSDVQDEYLATYLPEQVKIDQKTEIANFPENIPYADMSNDTPDVKTELLKKWEF